jgi:hypothetical protein
MGNNSLPLPTHYHRTPQHTTLNTMPKPPKRELKERMKLLPGGHQSIVDALAKINGGKAPIGRSQVGNILRGERDDLHGVWDAFMALTDIEKSKREQIAKTLHQEQLQP